MSVSLKCRECGNTATHPGDYCEYHYREFWKERWHPKNGWEAMRRFLFECFPDVFVESYGCPKHFEDMLRSMYDGFMNNKPISKNLSAFFIFRGGSKTTAARGGAAYALAYGLREYIIYRGSSANTAQTNFMDPLKSMISSPFFVEVFGNIIPPKGKGKFTERFWVLRNSCGTTVKCLGIDQPSRSSLARRKRPDWFIWDDTESIENTKTEDSRKNLIEKISGEDFGAAASDTSMGTFIQTPIHIDGLYFKIKAKKEFKKVEYWLYERDENGVFKVDNNGQKTPQWPEKFPLSWCLDQEKIYFTDGEEGKTSSIFNREYLGLIQRDEEKCILPELIQYATFDLKYEYNQNWIKVLTRNGKTEFPQKWESVDITLAVDPATSDLGKSCDTGAIWVFTTASGDVFFQTAFFGKYQNRDVLYNPAGVGYYEQMWRLEQLPNIQLKGIIGETFRCIIDKKPNRLVFESIGEYANTLKSIEDVKRGWYQATSDFDNHNFQVLYYKPGSSDEAKRDRIISSLQDIFNTGHGYLTGEPKKLTTDDNDNIGTIYPEKDLRYQLINLAFASKVDLADAAHMGALHRKRPGKIEYADIAYRPRDYEGAHSRSLVEEFHTSFL